MVRAYCASGGIRLHLRRAERALLAELPRWRPLRAKLVEVRDRRRSRHAMTRSSWPSTGSPSLDLRTQEAILGEPQWIASARRAGEFLWQHAFDEKSSRLRHHLFQGEASGEGFLDDYAMLGLAFLALGEATGEPLWVSRAQALGSAIMARFIKTDGLLVTSTADANLVLPAIDLDDHDTPSGTSAAYALLAQLGKTDARAMPRRRPRCWRAWRTKFNLHLPPGQALPPTLRFTGDLWRLNPKRHDSAAHVRRRPKVLRHSRPRRNPRHAHYRSLLPRERQPGLGRLSNADRGHIPSAPDAKITYPAGQVFKLKFSPEGISVYQGSVAIRAELPKGRTSFRREHAVAH